MSAQQILYLSRQDVENTGLEMPDVIQLLEAAFIQRCAGQVEMPPKLGIYPKPDALIHAMPAFIPSLQAAGMKWVSSYPENVKFKLPIIHGLIIMNDPETGVPVSVMDCTWITACRTGAATALAARYLARPDSRVVGIIACGAQGRTNLEALAAVFPIQRVYAYDISSRAVTQFMEEMTDRLGVEIIPVNEPRLAIVESDLVVTSGPIQKVPAPSIEAGWVKPGTFASSVDYGSYWTWESLAQFDKICTDDHAQYEYYRKAGYFTGFPRPYADLGEIAAGQKLGREHTGERTMSINLGMAMEDVVVAQEVYRRARQRGMGQWLSL